MTNKANATDTAPEEWLEITVELSVEVLEFFQKEGDDWEIRMDKVLREYVASQNSEAA